MSNNLISPKDKETLKNEGAGKTKKAQRKSSTATVSLLGDPNIRAGMVITIETHTKRNSGNYLVVSVDHSIDSSGGYTMTLELERRGAKSAKPKTQTNTQGIAQKTETTEKINTSVGATKPKQEKEVLGFDAAGKIKK